MIITIKIGSKDKYQYIMIIMVMDWISFDGWAPGCICTYCWIICSCFFRFDSHRFRHGSSTCYRHEFLEFFCWFYNCFMLVDGSLNLSYPKFMKANGSYCCIIDVASGSQRPKLLEQLPLRLQLEIIQNKNHWMYLMNYYYDQILL